VSLSPKSADSIAAPPLLVGTVPQPDSCTAATAFLFDQAVCAQHQPGWNLVTDRLRGPEIDDQLELGWLLDRDIRGLASVQDLVHLARGAAVEIAKVRAIGHETA
jgi:hypothetical protein